MSELVSQKKYTDTGIFSSILGRRIGIAVFASIIVIEIIVLIPSYLRQEEVILSQMDRQGEQLFEAIRSVDHLNLEGPLKHARILMQAKRIIGVVISPEAGTDIVLGSRPMLPNPDKNSNLKQNRRSADGLSYDVYWPKREAFVRQSVTLRFDASHIDDELFDFVTRVSLLTLVISLFVTFSTLLVLKFKILDSVLALRAGLLEGGGRSAKVPGKGLARDDELGDLYRSVRTMLEDVGKAHSDEKDYLKSFNDELEARVKERTEDLKQSEARFQTFASSASDWFWEMDDQLRFSYFSDRFSAITGVEKSVLLGKTRQETGIPYLTDSLWRNHLDDLANKRPFQNFVHPREMADGTIVFLSINGLPIYDDNGVFLGYQGTGKDVTSQIESERSLNQAKNLAESANLAKSEFLSTMSHELRTPLNMVYGYGQMLASGDDEPLSENQIENVDQILDSTRQLLDLIDQVLDLSSIEAGRLQISAEEIVMRDVFHECLEVVDNLAADKGQIVSSEFRTDRAIKVDYNRLRQIMLILLTNAVSYCEAESSIALICEDTSENKVRIMVSDSGPGISPEDQTAVFEPFNRLGRETGEIAGAGIGLTIAKRLTDVMGGTIGVESDIGHGSKFWIEFPVSGSGKTD
ncbi:MAG: PAS domain-containing sensor histidine kinase [Alphaproteobacteria bacterium]|jgi:PAS domain S-box-containing protein|nr:PAS domain-containing sensor histidine kinase [Alphaproteobacteria bacterium]MBT4085722.1 PAS domain-containing sensor histidine kinase [Alphaproteobacteria bacterium]MBT4543301.1 PAS domain-containing sensor histidine kinase [Alphaproteobacteria bacterium]MBT7747210.1 PAS domain-containing sensor histidine kinase [Alphaproteobacteria bacterium]